MADPFIGEIRMFGGNFAPLDWAFCDGSSVPVSQQDTLYALIGNTYGGNDQAFNLPDLRGRVPVHRGAAGGATFTLGQSGGTETVTLVADNLPAHTHDFPASLGAASTGTPSAQVVPAKAAAIKAYSPAPANAQMAAGALTPAGGGQSHENMMPFTVVTFIIALSGIYPTQS